MDLESIFKKMSRSWLTYGISLLLTLFLFLVIGSTRLGLHGVEDSAEADLLYYFPPPPPPVDLEKPLPLPSQPEATFKFDFPVEDETTEEIPLNPLTVTLSTAPNMETDFLIRLDRGLKPVKPNLLKRLVVYERDEVDVKPVRTYAPSVSLPTKLREYGANLIVLYRVTNNGDTEDIHILDTDSEEAINAAITIIEKSRFRPAYKNGEAVNVWVQHEMIFQDRSNISPFELSL